MPAPIDNRPAPYRPATLGDIRRVRQSVGPVAPASVGPAPDSVVIRDVPGGPGSAGTINRPPAPYEPQAVPQQQKGFFRRVWDWIVSLFVSSPPAPQPPAPLPPAPFPPQPGPAPVTPPAPEPIRPPAPAPGPVTPPAPGPVTPPAPGPVTPPTPGQTPGIRVFFTSAHTGTPQGLPKKQQDEANARARNANEAATKADANSPDKGLISLIDSVGPGGTLHGAFYDIQEPGIVEAFVRAKGRGVDVKLVTEMDYYYEPKSQTLRGPIAKLQAAGIPVIPDDRENALMHDKFLVANGQTVWTGSFNITEGGAFHENNNAIRLESTDLAAIYTQEFRKMFDARNFGTDANTGNPINAGTTHPVSRPVQIGTVTVTPYFSPSTAAQGGCKAAVLEQLAKARTSIQFLAFSFTDADIGNAMAEKARNGVKVEGVTEKTGSTTRTAQYAALNALEPAVNALYPANDPKLDVRVDTNPALMHHKVIIIDDSTVILGSFNFSASAQKENDENMLVIENAPDLVRMYREEFKAVQAVAVG